MKNSSVIKQSEVLFLIRKKTIMMTKNMNLISRSHPMMNTNHLLLNLIEQMIINSQNLLFILRKTKKMSICWVDL
jgi:hypothetical protein